MWVHQFTFHRGLGHVSLDLSSLPALLNSKPGGDRNFPLCCCQGDSVVFAKILGPCIWC